MTQAIAGFSGKVFISTNGGSTYSAVGEMRDATLSISNGEIDVTSFDSSGWAEYIPGLKEWEVDTEGLYVYADAGQSALYNALVNNTVVKVRLLPKNTTGQTGYQGDAFITSWEVNNTTDDAVSISASFRGTGALTTYTAP
ncbi:phage tail tube protein [Paenibacillus sp. HJGM_3]|uniref:phage tail tube protein n=1 Tax=Paenibacillus sp. HJGM_3 TaxID=3379816 RepID=UPI00385889EC